MNKIITLIMCVAFSATVSGQTVKVEDRVKTLEGDVKTLKSQLETQNGQIVSMQSRLNELADRNAEYKKALDIKQTLLTSSSCHPKVFVKEFCYFLMSCHQHCLGVNLLVQR